MNRLEKAFYKLDRDNLLVEQGYKCKLCSAILTRKTATLDHIIPKSKTAYRHSKRNSMVLCVECNSRKSNKPLEKFIVNPEQIRINSILNSIEKRIRLAEYRLSLETKGSFRKWERFHYGINL